MQHEPPGPVNDAPPDDLIDAASGPRARGVLRIASATDAMGPPEVVIVPRDREGTVTRTVEVLAADPRGTFNRGNVLVRVIDAGEIPPDRRVTRTADAPTIQRLPQTSLLERLGSIATFVQRVQDDEGRVIRRAMPCPAWIAKHLADRGEWPGLPRLRAVTTTPLLLPDGTITPAGFDPQSGIWYVERTRVEMPAHPTRADAAAAVRELLDVAVDFPFASDGDRGAFLCAVLTPLAVHAYDGPSPLNLAEASIQGSGKGKLVSVACIIATGRGPTMLTPTAEGEEERKRLTGIALGGDPTVLIDNVSGTLGSDALAIALTNPERMWSDRRLGVQETITVPLDAVFYVTSNNARLTPDMLRRTIVCRLEPDCERPEERSGFRYPDLLGHVRAQRPRLLRAALTILRAYQVAGRPAQQLAAFGSYEGWSATVRAAVVWAGAADPLANRDRLLAAADTEGPNVSALLDVLAQLPQPFTAKTITSAAAEDSALRLALTALHGEKEPTARRVGGVLAKYRGRVAGCRRLVCDGLQGGRTEWRVNGVGGVGGVGGVDSPNLRARGEGEHEGATEATKATEATTDDMWSPERCAREEST